MIEAINVLTAENERLKKQVAQWERFYPNHATAKNDGRIGAAIKCVEIAEAMHVDEYGNGQCGEIAELIKAHFGIKG